MWRNTVNYCGWLWWIRNAFPRKREILSQEGEGTIVNPGREYRLPRITDMKVGDGGHRTRPVRHGFRERGGANSWQLCQSAVLRDRGGVRRGNRNKRQLRQTTAYPAVSSCHDPHRRS